MVNVAHDGDDRRTRLHIIITAVSIGHFFGALFNLDSVRQTRATAKRCHNQFAVDGGHIAQHQQF